MTQQKALEAIRIAGAQDDQEAMIRIYTENRIGYVRAIREYRAGKKWAESVRKFEQHGVSCEKIDHGSRTGMLHGADDDRPYDVDGVMYCGRCHVCL